MKKSVPFALLTVAAVSAASSVAAKTAKPSHPNVIVILVDDQGYGGINCNPHTKRHVTPAVDALALSGVRCTQGYVSGYFSSPSRAGLLTGKYQQSFGFYSLDTPSAGGIPASEKLVSEYLLEAGYSTACFGKWHVGDNIRNHPNNRGFQHFFGFLNGLHDYFDPLIGGSWEGTHNGLSFMLDNMEPATHMKYSTYEFTDRAVNFIRDNASGPFFLYLPYNAIHSPLQAPDELIAEFADNPASPSKDDRIRAMTAAVDRGVGKIVSTLEELKIREKTIIFYLSDNGGTANGDNWELRGQKGSNFEGGIRIPFIVSYPGVIPAGGVYTQPVITLDVAPTVMTLAGAPCPGMHGVDLLPYLCGQKKTPPHEALYWSSNKMKGNPSNPASHDFAIRQGRWKLTSDITIVKDCNLYDLDADPRERVGLKDKYPDKYRELFAMYLAWKSKMPDEIYHTSGNARLKGAMLMRKYQQNLRKEGKKPIPLGFGPLQGGAATDDGDDE
ncbi:N-acetylgalactosamine-6-sulfatase [Bacteroidia bacterium]|nr:N-acetylgalactosamine-6-sulfatase [Bacteroidia bacterium]